MDINRDLLTKMGVSKDITERFLANRNYTPIDAAALVAALDSMHGVRGKPVYMARAAAADGRTIAYVMRRQAELMADDYHKHCNYARFIALATLRSTARKRRTGWHQAVVSVSRVSGEQGEVPSVPVALDGYGTCGGRFRRRRTWVRSHGRGGVASPLGPGTLAFSGFFGFPPASRYGRLSRGQSAFTSA
jgi:hypothetical protein